MSIVSLSDEWTLEAQHAAGCFVHLCARRVKSPSSVSRCAGCGRSQRPQTPGSSSLTMPENREGAANEHLRATGRVGWNEVAAVEAIVPEGVTVIVNGSVTAGCRWCWHRQCRCRRWFPKMSMKACKLRYLGEDDGSHNLMHSDPVNIKVKLSPFPLLPQEGHRRAQRCRRPSTKHSTLKIDFGPATVRLGISLMSWT